MPNDSGKFVRLDRDDEVTVEFNGESVTFRKLDSRRFEIIAHKRVSIHPVQKRSKSAPRLQPSERTKVDLLDE